MPNTKQPVLTVGELIGALSIFPEDAELIFQGGLTLYRTKGRGDDLVQIEFNEGLLDDGPDRITFQVG